MAAPWEKKKPKPWKSPPEPKSAPVSEPELEPELEPEHLPASAPPPAAEHEAGLIVAAITAGTSAATAVENPGLTENPGLWDLDTANQIEAAARSRQAGGTDAPGQLAVASGSAKGAAAKAKTRSVVSGKAKANSIDLDLVAAITPMGIIGRSKRESALAPTDNPRRSTEIKWQRRLRRQNQKEQADRTALQQSRKETQRTTTQKRSERQQQRSAAVRTRKLLSVAQRQWKAGRLDMAYHCVSEATRLLCLSLGIDDSDIQPTLDARKASPRPSTVDSSTQTLPEEGKGSGEEDRTTEYKNAMELLDQCNAALAELEETAALEAEEDGPNNLKSRSLPNIMNAVDRRDRRVPTPTTSANRERTRKSAAQWRAGLEKKTHDRADQSMRHAKGIFRIPQEMDLRRTLVNTQQGLSLQWGADEFAQVTAELVAQEPFDTSPDGAINDQLVDTSDSAPDFDVSDEMVGGMTDAFSGETGKPWPAADMDLPQLTPQWTRPHAGAGERLPGHEHSIEAMLTVSRTTPRRKGWSYDAEVIYADGSHRGRPSTRPHPLLWRDGCAHVLLHRHPYSTFIQHSVWFLLRLA